MPSSDSDRPGSSRDVAPAETPGNTSTGEWTERSTYDASPPRPAEPGPDPLAATDPAAQPPAQPPGSSRDGRVIQQYELIRELGRGGMGVVHLARDLRLGRLVAIKMLTKPGQHQRRFLAEARATARCRHENIVVIHDAGVHDEQPYLVFEYLRGQTLQQWMHARLAFEALDSSDSPAALPAPLTPTRAAEIMVPVVRALVCAHDMGIIHRDLKPANILLTEEGVTKVLDFGVAKIGAAGTDIGIEGAASTSGQPLALTELGTRLGTLPYMSPEQLAGEVVDHRSDLWAAGIILYELVTGAHPLAPLSPAKLHAIADLATPMPPVHEHRQDLGPLAEIIDRCLIKDREHRTATARELLQELEALLPAQRTRARDEESNPYTGLTAFQELDADRFFGRDHDISSIVAKLHHLPLLAVTGPSGAGKSSLVRAGVIPALKRAGEHWEAMVTRPGRQPLASLADAWLTLSGRSSEPQRNHQDAQDSAHEPSDRDAMVARLRSEPGYLGIVLRRWARARQRRLVLFVDQFEELYTLGSDAEERACVLACLRAVADDVGSPLRIILSIRSDFLDRLVEQRAFLDAVSHGLTFLSPLDQSGLREALVKPVAAGEYRFESPDMVERILAELEATRTPLPLLQFTANQLWARRDRQQRMLTESSLRALGGVSGALTSHADAVLASMPAHDARLARAVFLRLVTPERTRALATLAELRQLDLDAEAMDRVLTRLIEARLLAVESSSGNAAGSEEPSGVIEIVHESLIDTWPLLARWLVENEEDAMFLARLRSAARDWQRSGQAPGLLWSGQAAREAHAWRQRYQGELALGEEQYLGAVFAAAERQRRLRRRILGGTIAAITLVAVAMAYLAWQQSRASVAATRSAMRAEKEAMRARDATLMAVARMLPEDPTTQLALLRELEDTSAPPQGTSHELRRLLHADVARLVLIGHEGTVSSVTFSPDGSRIASGSSDKTIRVWNVDGSGAPLVLRGHERAVHLVKFSPDGSHVFSTDYDNTALIWNLDDPKTPRVLHGPAGSSKILAVSPDGSRIASLLENQTIGIWNTDGSGSPVMLPSSSPGSPEVVTISPDGARIAIPFTDLAIPAGKVIVQIWKTDGSGDPVVLRGDGRLIKSIAFSPDGSRILAATLDATVLIWNADGSGTPVVLRGHDRAIYSAVFSPDGTRVVSASQDETVRVWNADGSGTPRILRGHTEWVDSVAHSPDGVHVASAAADGTVRVWNALGSDDSWVLAAQDRHVSSIDLSPDGSRIVSDSGDGTVRIWNVDGSGTPIVLHGHESGVLSVTFSPDGTRIGAGGTNGTVYVWNADGSGTPIILNGQSERTGHQIDSVDFSPDGSRVVFSSRQDATVQIWNTDGSAPPIILSGYAVHKPGTEPVQVWSVESPVGTIASRGLQPGSAVFSPKGSHIAFAAANEVVIWNIGGFGAPLILHGHASHVSSVAFSPDGSRLASASWDRTIRIWEMDGSGTPVVLRGHEDSIWSVAFSSDGSRIVSTSTDGTMRIWNTDGTGEPLVLSAQAHDARFFPDGQRIVAISEQGIRVWEDVALPAMDDPRLWTITNYCMPLEVRQKLLGVSEEIARRTLQRCMERVEQARRAGAAPARR